MAKLILGIGTSHTPLLTFDGGLWEEYANRDFRSNRLNLSDGRYVPYAQLLEETKGKYADVATPEKFLEMHAVCQAALSTLAVALEESAPDVVIIVTDDESELFSRANTPAISIYYGDTIVTRPFSTRMRNFTASDPYFPAMAKSYAMDESRSFPGKPDFARHLIEGLIDRHVDVGAAAQVERPNELGFGHGVGFVIHRLLGGKPIPVVPVMLNTYIPPNTPLPARCYDVGRLLRAAIDESPFDLRVAIVASGGLSHFVVDETLDRHVLAAMCSEDRAALRSIPVSALNAGSSEIRNWLLVSGAMTGLKNEWLEYQPLYRTPAGTGVGVAFGVWR